ncbi:pyruvate kinase isozyme G [Carex littledalei]|uniref:Pyruvate kinase n=1 Tax=Carex littledalei TaxID=544730 RepID=A0A833R7J0_9POAL|nr:pyruvate kinase isozyme G [Carex littledalei]
MAAMEIGSMAAQISPVTRTNSVSRRVCQSIARSGSWAPSVSRRNLVVRSVKTSDANATVADLASPNGVVNPETTDLTQDTGSYNVALNSARKTKIVCTIGPSTNTREMIWKLAEGGMNVACMNMSHGDHKSHKKVIDLVKEYNAENKDGNVIAIMLDTKGPEVRSGDLPEPIMLKDGQELNFTINRGLINENTIGVNYDDFVNDVEVGDTLLVDGGMMSLVVRAKTADTVKCEVIDGGELTSRRHLNVRGKSATLPSITEKDWEDIKFGVENKVDFYAVSFVKDAEVVHELKDYLKGCNADIHVLVKIESADAIPNLQSIISASDGAMVARGDLGAELPIEDVPMLQYGLDTFEFIYNPSDPSRYQQQPTQQTEERKGGCTIL